MNVWIQIFHKAPSRWVVLAVSMAADLAQSPSNEAMGIVVFDKTHAERMRKENLLEWTPCGKVGSRWWYMDKREVKVHEPERQRPRADRNTGKRRQQQDVPSRGAGKRRPTRR